MPILSGWKVASARPARLRESYLLESGLFQLRIPESAP